MRIGTTPTYTFKLPFEVSTLQKIKVTFRQGSTLILEKKDSFVLAGNIIELSLTQAETFLFDNFNKIDIQLRVVTKDNDVLSSNIYSFAVAECLDKEVL